MLISKLGEFGLIERIRKSIRLDASVIKGSGDDCAVVKFNRHEFLLLTCDMLVEGVDFTRDDDPFLIGRKALAVSISDIAACAGDPRYALVSLGLPRGTTVAMTDKLSKGVIALAGDYKINIVGGDISRADKLVIDVSMVGVVKKEHLLLRSNAKAGDIIFVTGALGGSISGKHLRFIPRLKEAHYLSRNFKINSMIDISDGLAQDLGHILKSSEVGALIYEPFIPLSRQAKGLTDALFSGEDFELLFTMPPKEAKRLFVKSPHLFRPIGKIRDKKYGLRLRDSSNRERALDAKGFKHF